MVVGIIVTMIIHLLKEDPDIQFTGDDPEAEASFILWVSDSFNRINVSIYSCRNIL
ncbi:MAG: hypothetical protein ACJ71L_05895 [Nitrososphaeraceae archaeon]